MPSWLLLPEPSMQADAGGVQAALQVCAAVHVDGLVQSAFVKHCTQLDVLPPSRQRVVLPPQAAQVAPQAPSLLHTAHAPPVHAWLLGQPPAVQPQAPDTQLGVLPLHATQLAPQREALSQTAHVPLLQ